MSDSSFNPAAGAVPEQGNVAPPESADHEAPQGGDSQESQDEQEPQEPKTFTQEEVDAMVAKRTAKAERQLRRELAQAVQEPQHVNTGEPPNPKDFPDALTYTEALADYKAEQKLAQREAEKQRNAVDSTYSERAEAARDKYEDFDDVVGRQPKDGGPAISEYMAEVIKASEMGPELAYHLGKNPGESRRIWALPPLLQAKELGKLETSLTTNPPVKKTSSAPDPITPVRRSGATPTYDTTDPRSIKSMTDSEWIEAERRRQMKKFSTQ